ncbi:hypothetical protein [Streptomyces sp. BR123]|uniref:hypothetical protein n=1 Tax=Streptomyces sp. BR123 TaxID=2749828 RepID=UPI00211AE8F9|nr:hypothetical protein [Streptomyces sp. BR123]
MPLSQTRAPRSHRARSTRRRADAAAAVGRRALRRPLMLSAAGGLHPAALAAVALAALLLLGVAARAGALTNLWDFLDFGAGVLSLVSLTSAVLWGLAATDRLLFTSGLRIVAQGVHRGLAVSGLGFLALHIWIKIAESRTGVVNALIPFTDEDQPVLIGLGSLAGYLFISVAVSGAVRSAFATKGRSLWWRALHVGAYPAWGASLVHGLQSGRVAAGWVTVAYGMCIVGVAGVLLVRLRRRLQAERDRPAAAQQQSAARGTGPDQTRSTDRFLRRPAEWAAERLTARIARQTDDSAGPRPGPLADPPAPTYPGSYADPVQDPLLTAATVRGVPSQRPPLSPVPANPPYGAGAAFVTSRLDVSTDRPGGRSAGGARRRS